MASLESLVISFAANLANFTQAMEKSGQEVNRNLGQIKRSIEALKTAILSMAGVKLMRN